MDSSHHGFMEALKAAPVEELMRRLRSLSHAHVERLRKLGLDHGWTAGELVLATMQRVFDRQCSHLHREGQSLFGFLATALIETAATRKPNGH